MKPKYFKEAEIELKKPASMTDEECESLWVYRDLSTCISLWHLDLWERIKLLFHGNIWLGVMSGQTQPPVWFECKQNIFRKEREKK